MRDVYTAKLSRLSDEILEMGNLCGQAIMKTCQLLASVEIREAATKEIGRIEKEIDDKEHNIEALCMQLLLKQQPVGTDLRKISAALKMVTDMERIGIQACEIAEIIAAGNVVRATDKVDFQELSDEVSHMVQMAMMAYDKKNLDLADEVIKYDDVVDKLFCDIRGDLIKQLKDDTNDAECFIDMLMIDKYFERIGDHAVNIARWVKFSITGEIQIVE